MPTPNVTALCAMEEGAPEVLRNIREDYRARCEESDHFVARKSASDTIAGSRLAAV